MNARIHITPVHVSGPCYLCGLPLLGGEAVVVDWTTAETRRRFCKPCAAERLLNLEYPFRPYRPEQREEQE